MEISGLRVSEPLCLTQTIHTPSLHTQTSPCAARRGAGWNLSSLVFLFALSVQFASPAVSFAQFVSKPVEKPFGNPKALQGGTFTINATGEPTTLNPITSTDLYATTVHGYVMDSLLDRNPETYEVIPGLAEKFEISEDGKLFTFTIRKDAKWSDGKPLTAEDVKFSFDVIFDSKYNAIHLRPYFEGIEKAEVVDPQTVRFTAKTKYFGNLDTLASMVIFPKHFYGNAEEGKKKNKTLLGSGAYKLEKYDQGQSIILVKNKEWWGNNVPSKKGEANFEHIRMRFMKDDNIVVESLKKGDLDYIEPNQITPEAFVKNMVGPEWGKTVEKVKTQNHEPKSYGYIGWNFKSDIFSDRDVRLALYHLLNREEMNKKFRYGMSELATGPWSRDSEYADPAVKPVLYNVKEALALLKKAGWSDSDKTGTLRKTINGQKRDFHFTLIYGNPDTEKYWVMFQNDLKKVGIQMDLQRLEWNALIKALDEQKFDAAALAWGGGLVDLDPKQIWYSKSAGKGGSNFISYNNPEVDKLIEEARSELDKNKRIVLLRKCYALIAADAPYAFLFNWKYVLYAHTLRTKRQKDTYKFKVGTEYWWAAP